MSPWDGLVTDKVTVKDYLGLLLSHEHLHCGPEMEVWIMCLHMHTWTAESLAAGPNRSDGAENHIRPHLPKSPCFSIRASWHSAGQKSISALIVIAVVADPGLPYMSYTRKINTAFIGLITLIRKILPLFPQGVLHCLSYIRNSFRLTQSSSWQNAVRIITVIHSKSK